MSWIETVDESKAEGLLKEISKALAAKMEYPTLLR
jgi:hypothetical protein